MTRMYEGKTAAEVVRDVMNHGLSLDQEDICKMQDIFGHTSVEELDRLANDIGRDNGIGHPDPDGTMSSGRRGTRDAFYRILFHIWNWEDAVRFWNQHSNPDLDRMDAMRDRNHLLTMKLETEVGLRKEAESSCDYWQKEAFTAQDIAAKANDKLHKAERDILKLKATLYDLMTEEAE